MAEKAAEAAAAGEAAAKKTETVATGKLFEAKRIAEVAASRKIWAL